MVGPGPAVRPGGSGLSDDASEERTGLCSFRVDALSKSPLVPPRLLGSSRGLITLDRSGAGWRPLSGFPQTNPQFCTARQAGCAPTALRWTRSLAPSSDSRLNSTLDCSPQDSKPRPTTGFLRLDASSTPDCALGIQRASLWGPWVSFDLPPPTSDLRPPAGSAPYAILIRFS